MALRRPPPTATAVAAAGFTLIELLVALAVFALMAALGWQGIDGLLRSQASSQAQVARQLRLGAALAQWEADLAALHDTRELPALAFDGAALRLTRQQEDGVQMVVWQLRGGSWTRWAGPPVSRHGELETQWQQAQQLQGREPGHNEALAGVLTWQVYFWRNNAWTNAQSSGDAAADGGQQLPGGVRLQLSLEGPGGADTPLTLLRDLQLSLGPRG